MIELEKGNQVYKVTEDCTLCKQLKEAGFKEKENTDNSTDAPDRDKLKQELAALGVDFDAKTPTTKLVKLLEEAKTTKDDGNEEGE